MTHSILIVDDDTAIMEAVEEYLKILKYDVKSASNADEALRMLESFKPDIVLTDIMMQGMDGLELTRKIKASFNTDVIVMTGYSAAYSYEEAIQAGAGDFIFKPFRFEELDLRIKRVLREAELKKERTLLLKELEKLAITDALTGLYNSRHFFSQLKMEIKRYDRYSRALSLLILDIDYFKQFNDTYGHQAGDLVLAETAGVILSGIREIDLAIRDGGEELLLLLADITKEVAVSVAERLRKEVSEHRFAHKDQVIPVTISLGMAVLHDTDTLETLFQRADQRHGAVHPGVQTAQLLLHLGCRVSGSDRGLAQPERIG